MRQAELLLGPLSVAMIRVMTKPARDLLTIPLHLDQAELEALVECRVVDGNAPKSRRSDHR
jgi:hypothetical protein